MTDFMVSVVVTKAGAKFARVESENNGVDDAAFAKLMKMSDEVLKAGEKAKDKGGPLTAVFTRNGVSKTLNGITYGGLSDIEDAMDGQSKALRQMGRDHAKHK